MSAYSTRKEEVHASVRLDRALYHLRGSGRSDTPHTKPHAAAPADNRGRLASMIASMTGFARRETTGVWGTLVCELRSVNHRFLEASFRLPDELRAAEGELRARLSRGVRRGKVDCTITYRRAPGAGAALEVDTLALGG